MQQRGLRRIFSTDRHYFLFRLSVNGPVNQAAPEPIFFGIEAGSGGLANTAGIDASNPYNPFGTNSPNGSFIMRRPVEGGPCVFRQNHARRIVCRSAGRAS